MAIPNASLIFHLFLLSTSSLRSYPLLDQLIDANEIWLEFVLRVFHVQLLCMHVMYNCYVDLVYLHKQFYLQYLISYESTMLINWVH